MYQCVLHVIDTTSLNNINVAIGNEATVESITFGMAERRRILALKKRSDRILNFIPFCLFLHLLVTFSARISHITSKVMHFYGIDIIEMSIAIPFTFGLVLFVYFLNKRSEKMADDIAVRVLAIEIDPGSEVTRERFLSTLQNETAFSFTGLNCFDINLRFLVGFIGTLITLSVLLIQILNINDSKIPHKH